jgi:hypothetical protein
LIVPDEERNVGFEISRESGELAQDMGPRRKGSVSPL